MWLPLLAAVDTASALDQGVTELGLIWMLSVDGEPAGTREVRVHYEGQSGDRVRIFEAYTEVWGEAKRKKQDPPIVYRQRLTANSHEGAPASFHATIDDGGLSREVQARWASGTWRLAVTDAAGTQTSTINPSRLDLSTVDLFDPESSLSLVGRDHARVLDAVDGTIVEGPVISLGASEIEVGGEPLWVDGWEWRPPQGTWRLFYALNGFVVRFEGPVGGRVVDAKLIGGAPRAIDEFGVPAPPQVEELDLPEVAP